MVVVPRDAQVCKPTDGYPNLTGGGHCAERDPVIGA
jgi:hypothetical protein